LNEVNIGIVVTNPQIVDCVLSRDKQNIILFSKQLGYSFLKVFLSNQPDIYDIFIVNVGSIIEPASSLNIHIGGTI